MGFRLPPAYSIIRIFGLLPRYDLIRIKEQKTPKHDLISNNAPNLSLSLTVIIYMNPTKNGE